MDERVEIQALLERGEEAIGETVTVAGWVQSVRAGGKGSFHFVMLNDGSGLRDLQVFVGEAERISEVVIASSILCTGEVVSSPGKEQAIELKASSLTILGGSDPLEYPLAKKKHSLEFLRTIGHLRFRSKVMSTVMRVRNALAFATHEFYQERGFLYLNTPILTGSDCEGAGETFTVTTLLDSTGKVSSSEEGFRGDFFKKPAYLTVSGQLNAEAVACGMGKVYTFGPTFRAEHSSTSRHLAEFWMIEPEIAFCELSSLIDLEESYIKHLIKTVLERCPEEMEFLEGFEEGETVPLRTRLQVVIDTPLTRVSYTEAIRLLEESGVEFEVKPYWGIDMGSEHERWLAEKKFQGPVAVYDYPKEIKSFYMRLNDDGKTVASVDLLIPGIGELIGGSQREERYDLLLQRIQEAGLNQETYQWYLDLRKFGTVPHSGFGLGFERMVCFVTGMKNIREAIPFPRWPGHVEF